MRRGAFKILGCCLVATTVTLLLAIIVIIWFYRSSPPHVVAWSGYQAICEMNGRELTVWRLRSRKGSFIDDARIRFCLCPSSFAYWSEKDASLCTVSQDAAVQWFDLGRLIRGGEWVSGLSCYGNIVLINLKKSHPIGALPTGCIAFDRKARRARRLSDVVFAVGRNNTMVLVQRSGEVTMEAAGIVRKTNLLLPTNEPGLVLDIDSDGKYIYVYPYKRSHRIACYDIEGDQVRLRWVTAFLLVGPIDGLQWIPERKELWCSIALPFTSGFIVLSYDYEGQFNGKRLEHSRPINTPFVVGDRDVVRMRALLQLGDAKPFGER